jgi:gluconate 2-dehydrogenase alpha chain
LATGGRGDREAAPVTAVKLPQADVVIVGMGVVGTIIAKELAATGLKIVGLERGRMVDTEQDFAMPYAHDELKYARQNDLLQDLSRETLTFRNDLDETALPMREIGSFKLGECVGGAGVLWGGVSHRLLPWEFELRTRTVERYGKKQIEEGCTSQDWGIGYEELEPYYDQFEHIYGVGGKAGNINGEIQPGGNPFEGWRSREYPNPPSEQTFAGSLFAQAASSLGYTPFPSPTAAMTQAYTNPYRLMLGQCVSGGFCGSFGCAMGAKGTPLTAVIPALFRHPNFELRAHANVTKVVLDSEGKRATGVVYFDAKGRELLQPADLVILASYTFNNARLMLLSGIGRPYDPRSGKGVIGRNYAYQSGDKIRLFFEDESFNSFMGGGGLGVVIDDFNGDNFDHTGLSFIGGASVNLSTSGALPIQSHPVPKGTPRWGSDWKRAVAQYYNRSLFIRVHGACQSYRMNYLDLDPTYRDAYGQPLLRMTFDFRDNDRRMSSYIVGKVMHVARAMAPSVINPDGDTGKYSIVPYQSTHNTGGVAMGANPGNSAVNKFLQSWDVPNVFVVGGSAFPQNSGNHPTGTIGALACWAADAIKDIYLKRPGPMV